MFPNIQTFVQMTRHLSFGHFDLMNSGNAVVTGFDPRDPNVAR